MNYSGLVKKIIFGVQGELKLENQQVLSLYLKVMKKFYKYLSGIASKETLPSASRLKEVSELKMLIISEKDVFLLFSYWCRCFQISLEPHPVSVDDDLNDGAKQVEVYY